MNVLKFAREVKQEASKVTWPSRKETGVSTTMVLVMVTLAALFFLVVDLVLSNSVKFLLGI